MAKSPTFPSFHGAEVTYETGENGSHRIRSILPFPGAPHDRIVVTTVAGAEVDPQIVYQVNKRDVLAEVASTYQRHDDGVAMTDARVSSPPPGDDREAWAKRLNESHLIVREGQIMRPFRAGQMEPGDAIKKLVAAGFPYPKIAELIDTAMPEHQTAWAATQEAGT